MSQARSNSRRAFLWQGILILLPILILAGVGVYAIRQDRAGVEQEARERVAELARDLSTRLGWSLASELSQFESVGNLWAGDGRTTGGFIVWPSGPPFLPSERENYEKILAEWQSNYPNLRPEDVLPVQSRLMATSKPAEQSPPADYTVPPVPAPWLSELTEDQQFLWFEASRKFADGSDCDSVQSALNKFLETNPPPSSKANADFRILLCGLAKAESAERVTALVRFAGAHIRDLSENGLPLSVLALARALHETGEAGLSRELFETVSATLMIGPPSYLAPYLLDEIERLASRQSAAIQDAVSKVRPRWKSRQRRDALTQKIQQLLQPTSALTTNVWFDWAGQRWFATLDEASPFSGILKAGLLRMNAPWTRMNIRFFPESAVKRAAEMSLRKLDRAIPPYFEVKLLLENHSVLDQTSTNAPMRPPVLAQSESRLSHTADLEYLPGTEAWPSRPRVVVEIALSNPSLLYARARQRAWIFGSLIILAAIVASLGLAKMAGALAKQQRLSELKTNFVSSVSHELRAPLASVRLMAEGLESGRVRDEPKQREYFKFIVQECRRLTALVENVLDFSRIEQGRKQYDFEPTNIVALVEQTVKLMEPYAAERNVTLVTALDRDRLAALKDQLCADGRALQQALVNLIDNAIKHSSKDATVTAGLDWSGRTGVAPVSASQESKSGLRTTDSMKKFETAATAVLLWVEDHGSGIPPEEHERIFERFYRRGSELRRETQGVGIGLSIVKHIVEAHGGRVLIESTVGKGSRFTIELPLKG